MVCSKKQGQPLHYQDVKFWAKGFFRLIQKWSKQFLLFGWFIKPLDQYFESSKIQFQWILISIILCIDYFLRYQYFDLSRSLYCNRFILYLINFGKVIQLFWFLLNYFENPFEFLRLESRKMEGEELLIHPDKNSNLEEALFL